MTVAIIDNYDSFTYNLYQLVQTVSSVPVVVHRNDRLTFPELLDLSPTHVILSPGPGHPGNDGDFGICKEVILRQAELGCPVLGVCLGHQGIVHHLGGQVVSAPTIVHGKTSRVAIVADSPLFAGLPDTFEAMRYHSLIASEDTMPDRLRVTARVIDEPLVMAVQHESRPLYGVQFHPESISTPEGSRILRNFLELC